VIKAGGMIALAIAVLGCAGGSGNGGIHTAMSSAIRVWSGLDRVHGPDSDPDCMTDADRLEHARAASFVLSTLTVSRYGLAKGEEVLGIFEYRGEENPSYGEFYRRYAVESATWPGLPRGWRKAVRRAGAVLR